MAVVEGGGPASTSISAEGAAGTTTTTTTTPPQPLSTTLSGRFILAGAILCVLVLLQREASSDFAEGGSVSAFISRVRGGGAFLSSTSPAPSALSCPALRDVSADVRTFMPPLSFVPCLDAIGESRERVEAVWRDLEAVVTRQQQGGGHPPTTAAAGAAASPACPWPGLRGLFALPIGGKNAVHVDKLARAFVGGPFDLLLIAFDGTDWEREYPLWATAPNVKIERSPGGKWTFAKRFLTPEVVDRYSHLFFWDDDIVPIDGFFNPSLALALLQATPEIELAQPYVVGSGCHMGCHADFTGGHGLPFEVEIMVPIFSRAMWRCLYKYVDEGYPKGWGLELAEVCACGATYSETPANTFLMGYFRVSHLDTKGMGMATAEIFSDDWARKGWALLEERVRAEVDGADACIKALGTITRAEFLGDDLAPSRLMCFVGEGGR
jgi:hypothetical protein